MYVTVLAVVAGMTVGVPVGVAFFGGCGCVDHKCGCVDDYMCIIIYLCIKFYCRYKGTHARRL